jgi:hypothetical protein
MGDIVVLGYGLLSCRVVVALVQTQVLRCLLSGLGALDHDRVEGLSQGNLTFNCATYGGSKTGGNSGVRAAPGC